uniref:G protein-coupled receptor n=1 Tax=Globodera pallida TaxID=36090 RepID=A0A183CL96_GLOPA
MLLFFSALQTLNSSSDLPNSWRRRTTTTSERKKSAEELGVPECKSNFDCVTSGVCVKDRTGRGRCFCSSSCPLMVPVQCENNHFSCESMGDSYMSKYDMRNPLCYHKRCICPPQFDPQFVLPPAPGFNARLPTKCDKRELRVVFAATPSNSYYNNVHDFHNYVVVTVIMGTYLVFSCLLMMKIYKFKSSSQQSYSQKMIFIQVVLISSINAFASGIYVYMQYTTISKPLIVIAQLSWLFAHGIPSLIYLGLNKTIRKDCASMTLGLISRVSGKSTMLSSSRALTTTNVRAFGRGHTSVSTRHASRVAPTISTMPNVAQQNDEQKF